MNLGIELRTRQYRQNAQTFGPELLDQILEPTKNTKSSKVCPSSPRDNIAAAKAVYREFLYRMDGFER